MNRLAIASRMLAASAPALRASARHVLASPMNWKNAAPLLASRSLHTSVTMGLVLFGGDGAHLSKEARKSFAKILDAEIKDAQSDDEPLPEAFGDFKVHNVGQSKVAFSRTTQQGEQITVRLNLNDCEIKDEELDFEDDEAQQQQEEEQADLPEIRVFPFFEIELAKANGAKLHFKGCHVSEEGSLEFQALAHSQGAADETEVYHTNAEFLNDEFYDALIDDFLVSRGITQDFVDFVVDYVDQKENGEYKALLSNIKAFNSK